VSVKTPFGQPSDEITIGRLGSTRIAFLPRHGKGHHLSPTEIPYRANIYALKELGVERIISVNAAGSLKEAIEPGHLVIPDQLIDRTRARVNSFFSGGIVAHIIFAEPFCPVLSRILYQTGHDAGAAVHRGGTYLVIEGPALSTRAESTLYCSWGADIIGMTALPEARLAREAEMCYGSIVAITDYDCWQLQAEPTSIDRILDRQKQNTDMINEIVQLAICRIPNERSCICSQALKTAIVTDPESVTDVQKERFKLLTDKYLPRGSC
jgi:5'-methylthioadenosine phosphorylase